MDWFWSKGSAGTLAGFAAAAAAQCTGGGTRNHNMRSSVGIQRAIMQSGGMETESFHSWLFASIFGFRPRGITSTVVARFGAMLVSLLVQRVSTEPRLVFSLSAAGSLRPKKKKVNGRLELGFPRSRQP
ncbi:hypothetical protein IWX91DRAFT_59070 [Phyllosticta citricarpa]